MSAEEKPKKPRIPRDFRIAYENGAAVLYLKYELNKYPLKYFERLRDGILLSPDLKITKIYIKHQHCLEEIKKDSEDNISHVFIKKFNILYAIFDHIITNNQSLLRIDFSNFHNQITSQISSLDLNNLIQKINFKNIVDINLSHTHITNDIANYLYNNYHNFNALEKFEYYNILSTKEDYFLIIRMYIDIFNSFRFIICDINLLKYMDEIIDFVLNSDAYRIYLEFDHNAIDQRYRSSRSPYHFSVFRFFPISEIIRTQANEIMDIILRLIEKNQNINVIQVFFPNIGWNYPPLVARLYMDNSKLIKVIEKLQYDDKLEIFEFNSKEIHTEIFKWSLLPIDTIHELFKNNGKIELIGFIIDFDNYEERQLTSAMNYRNKMNNRKRNESLYFRLFEYANNRNFWEEEKETISIRKRKPNAQSRLQGYAKNKTIKYLRNA